MTKTVNYTGTVDRDLLKRAEMIAAKTETSIDALLNAALRHHVETFEAAETGGNQTRLDAITQGIVDQQFVAAISQITAKASRLRVAFRCEV